MDRGFYQTSDFFDKWLIKPNWEGQTLAGKVKQLHAFYPGFAKYFSDVMTCAQSERRDPPDKQRFYFSNKQIIENQKLFRLCYDNGVFADSALINVYLEITFKELDGFENKRAF